MNSLNANKTLVAYVATPHQGYVNFFRKYEGSVLYIFGEEIIAKFPSLVRNLPGNNPQELKKMIEALDIFAGVFILKLRDFDWLLRTSNLVMPDEDVSHALADEYLAGADIFFDGSWRLRWDLEATIMSRPPEGEISISLNEFDREIIGVAKAAADRSSDWWRQVGAVLVRDKEVLLIGFNKHFPSEQSPYLYGDPRSNFSPGQHIELSSALHGEMDIVTQAARLGISTEGCDLYVTTFPCPGCAYACANLGLKRLFYAEGYSLISGADTLRSKNVELIRVDMNNPSS
jgi:dCMP deaminase